MADHIIPSNAPGIAGFATESWASKPEPRYGDTPSPTVHENVKAAANLTLDLYDVIAIDTSVSPHVITKAVEGDPATGILAMPIAMAANQVMSVAYYVGGDWNMNALGWDASYTTDDQKRHAFEGGPNPMIKVQKANFDNNTIPV